MNKFIASLASVCISCGTITAQTSTTYDLGGLVSELNEIGEGDGYPWLSSDGHRLYFSKQAAFGVSTIVMAERQDLSDEFEITAGILEQYAQDHTSFWLSPDELEIYFTAAGTLWRSVRLSTVLPFINPVQLDLIGGSSLALMKSPSLTPDGSQLYILNGSGAILRYNRTSADQYTYAAALNTGFAVNGGGKLDFSGLRFYYSGDNGAFERPYRMSRQSIAEDFGNIQQVTGSVFTSDWNWIQPMIGPDENTMVLVRGEGMWQDNDLFIATGNGKPTAVLSLDKECLGLYPNPTADIFRLGGDCASGIALVEILTFSGHLVQSFSAPLSGYVFDIGHLPSGAYMVKTVRGGTVGFSKLFVSR